MRVESPSPKGQVPTAGRVAKRVAITKQVEFSAAHRLWNPAFDEARNWATFGICNNPKGHGHNYVLDVTLVGEPDPETGMIIDLKRLKEILDEVLILAVDHKNLNEDVPFLRGVIPTVENLVIAFWERLESRLDGCRLSELTLYESRTNFARYRGPSGASDE